MPKLVIMPTDRHPRLTAEQIYNERKLALLIAPAAGAPANEAKQHICLSLTPEECRREERRVRRHAESVGEDHPTYKRLDEEQRFFKLLGEFLTVRETYVHLLYSMELA